MGIRQQDIGLRDSIRNLVNSVQSSDVYFITVEDDDFNPDAAHAQVELTVPAFGVRVMRAEEKRLEFGSEESEMYAFSIATPDPPFEGAIKAGLWAVVDFSYGVKVLRGRIVRADYKLSSLIRCYLDVSQVPPFTNLELGIPV